MVAGGLGAAVRVAAPVVMPETTDGVAAVGWMTDGTCEAVLKKPPLSGAVPEERVVPGTHAAGKDARAMGIPSRTLSSIRANRLRGNRTSSYILGVVGDKIIR